MEHVLRKALSNENFFYKILVPWLSLARLLFGCINSSFSSTKPVNSTLIYSITKTEIQVNSTKLHKLSLEVVIYTVPVEFCDTSYVWWDLMIRRIENALTKHKHLKCRFSLKLRRSIKVIWEKFDNTRCFLCFPRRTVENGSKLNCGFYCFSIIRSSPRVTCSNAFGMYYQ